MASRASSRWRQESREPRSTPRWRSPLPRERRRRWRRAATQLRERRSPLPRERRALAARPCRAKLRLPPTTVATPRLPATKPSSTRSDANRRTKNYERLFVKYQRPQHPADCLLRARLRLTLLRPRRTPWRSPYIYVWALQLDSRTHLRQSIVFQKYVWILRLNKLTSLVSSA